MLQALYSLAALAFFIALIWLIVAAVRKRPKKPPLVLLIVSLVVGAVLTPFVETQPAAAEVDPISAVSEPTATAEPTPTSSENPVETAVPEETVSSDSTSVEADSGDLSLDLLAATLSLTLQENFPNSDVTYDNSSITMNVWDDNIAAGALLAQQGNEELQQSWNEMRGNLRQMCESTKDTISDAGYPDVTVTLNLLNDMNQDNILLTIVDGVVTYDVVYNYEM